MYIGPRIRQDGLVLHLDAINIDSYPGSGTTWFDISKFGTQKNAELQNTISHTGTSFLLDGVSSRARIFSPAPSLTFTPNNWTIELAIKSTAATGGWILTPTSAGSDHTIRYDLGGARIGVGITESTDVNNRTRFSTTGSAPLNRWTLVSVVINGLNIKIYIDGILNSEFNETISIANWSGTWDIGYRSITNSFYFGGELAYIRAYNTEISANDIYNNYLCVKSRYGK
jgi:hypothetical protein